MSIANYTDLQNAVLNWINRAGDSEMIARCPEWITLAEAQIQRKIRRTTVSATLSIASNPSPLPSDCAELRSIVPQTGTVQQNIPVRIVTPEQYAEALATASGTSGTATYAMVVGTNLYLSPTPSPGSTAFITYFQKFTPLISAPSGINAILTEFPDLYLYTTLANAAPYLEDDSRAPQWASLAQSALDAANEVRMNEEMGASLRPERLAYQFG